MKIFQKNEFNYKEFDAYFEIFWKHKFNNYINRLYKYDDDCQYPYIIMEYANMGVCMYLFILLYLNLF